MPIFNVPQTGDTTSDTSSAVVCSSSVFSADCQQYFIAGMKCWSCLLLWCCGCFQYPSTDLKDLKQPWCLWQGSLFVSGLLQAEGLNLRCSWPLCSARVPALLQSTSTGWQVCRRFSKLWLSLARCVCGAGALAFLSHFEKPAGPHPQLVECPPEKSHAGGGVTQWSDWADPCSFSPLGSCCLLCSTFRSLGQSWDYCVEGAWHSFQSSTWKTRWSLSAATPTERIVLVWKISGMCFAAAFKLWRFTLAVFCKSCTHVY